MTSGALGRGLTFDEVAADYDRYRPRYPDPLFATLATQTGLDEDGHVLEVGCGTGQATEALIRRGWHVLAVEPGEAMARTTRDNINDARFAVEVSTFDAWDPQERTFDAVFSATAYHWVHPSLRWVKASDVLKPEGFIALATNRTVLGASFNEFYDATSAWHHEFGLGDDDNATPSADQFVEDVRAAGSDIGAAWEATWHQGTSTLAGDRFAAPSVSFYPWSARYDTDHALGLLSTYSLYLTMRPQDRRELFTRMRELIIDHFEGELTRNYVSVLAVAQKR